MRSGIQLGGHCLQLPAECPGAVRTWLAACRKARAAPVPHTQPQPALRRIVYESDLQVAVLPSEYNFRPISPDYARNGIKIIRGRWTYGQLQGTSEDIFR